MIRVTVQNDKTIQNPLEIDLGTFTIFAGENNSGKTQLIEEISKELETQGKNVIKIPAERVILENEISVSTAKDPFRESMSRLLNLTLKDDGLEIESGIDDIESELPNIFSEYGVSNIELSAKKGAPRNEDYVKVLKEMYIKKALDNITVKDGDVGGIQLKDAGQGTERLAVVAFLQYLAFKGINSNEEVFLIIEEPEIYLHPKLKRTFFRALKRLNENNISVIITTHDPYFISLSADELVYQVCREGTGLTEIERTNNAQSHMLSYRSNAEINYFIFDIPTIECALQLYEAFIKGNSNKEGESIDYAGTEKTPCGHKK